MSVFTDTTPIKIKYKDGFKGGEQGSNPTRPPPPHQHAYIISRCVVCWVPMTYIMWVPMTYIYLSICWSLRQ
jgi:hypothetical protein